MIASALFGRQEEDHDDVKRVGEAVRHEMKFTEQFIAQKEKNMRESMVVAPPSSPPPQRPNALSIRRASRPCLITADFTAAKIFPTPSYVSTSILNQCGNTCCLATSSHISMHTDGRSRRGKRNKSGRLRRNKER